MSIPQRPQGSANPPQPSTEPTSATADQTPCAAVLAVLQDAALDRDLQRSAGLAVLNTLANEQNAWRPFTVTALASPQMLNLSRNTISRALRLIEDRGYLEERKPRNARPGQREARLLLSVR